MTVRRAGDAHAAHRATAPKGEKHPKKPKGQHAAKSGYAEGQCKSDVLYKPGSPCGRKLVKGALEKQLPLYGDQGSIIIQKLLAIDPKLLDGGKKLLKTKKVK